MIVTNCSHNIARHGHHLFVGKLACWTMQIIVLLSQRLIGGQATYKCTKCSPIILSKLDRYDSAPETSCDKQWRDAQEDDTSYFLKVPMMDVGVVDYNHGW
jgi:hypothetical protein